MRSRITVYVAVSVASVLVSALLWRQLRTARQDLQTAQQALQSEREIADQLRGQLADARAQPVVAAPVPPVQSATAPPILAATDGRTTANVMALASVGAQRDKILLDDPEYHKARLAEVRATLKQRNPLLARELGISEEQADVIIDIMAQGQLREDSQQLELMALGSPDPAAIEEMKHQQEAQQQQDQNTLMTMLGPAKYAQLEEVQQTEIAHVRMVNLKTLLAQSGQPLSADQALSMTRVMESEQQREEKEMQQLRSSGQWNQASQVDSAVEGDRRILDNASGILSAQQLEAVRVRFEQRQATERASGAVTLRARGLGQ